MAYKPGDISLPLTLSERTIVRRAAPTLTSAPGLIGSVVDLYGTPVNGMCSQGFIDVGSISPGSVLKNDVKVPMTASSQVHFNDIVERQKGLSVGYLAVTASMSNEDRAEVLVEDVAEQAIENFDRDKDSTKLAAYEAAPLSNGACGRYVITKVVLTAIKYRVYTKKTQAGGVVGILNIGGKNYYSHTKQLNDLVLAVVLRPIRYKTPQESRQSEKPPNVVELR
jgi:hypothetical protein